MFEDICGDHHSILQEQPEAEGNLEGTNKGWPGVRRNSGTARGEAARALQPVYRGWVAKEGTEGRNNGGT